MIDSGAPAGERAALSRQRLYSFERLWRAYRQCRRNKRNTSNALAFEVDAEAKLLSLQAELLEHRYQPGASICFVTEGPKPREVFAADFRDRVVHHLLVAELQPRFEPAFIHDSYACRPGKGVLAASDRLMQFLRGATANGKRAIWAIKLDVASFFPSIDKQILFDLLQRRVKDPELRWLSGVILFHDPTENYRFKAGAERIPPPGSGRYPIAAQKSLFGNDNQRGLPIGNLTSQFWANVYLDSLDQFIKRELKCRYYLRYVDDLVLLDPDPDRLRQWRDRIQSFLQSALSLRLRESAVEPRRAERGIDFVGWQTYWSYRLPRRRTLAKCEAALSQFEREALRPMWNGLVQRIDIAPSAAGRARADLEHLRSAVSSYAGHLRHGSSSSGWARICARHQWVGVLFERAGDGSPDSLRWSGERLPAAPFRRQYGQLLENLPQATFVVLPGRWLHRVLRSAARVGDAGAQPAARALRSCRLRLRCRVPGQAADHLHRARGAGRRRGGRPARARLAAVDGRRRPPHRCCLAPERRLGIGEGEIRRSTRWHEEHEGALLLALWPSGPSCLLEFLLVLSFSIPLVVPSRASREKSPGRIASEPSGWNPCDGSRSLRVWQPMLSG